MNVGQYISLKSNADYADVYDAPAISSHAEGVTAGYIGKITKLNVQGIGDTHFFIEVVNQYNEKKYLVTVDKDLFEVSDTNPLASTNNNTGGTIGGGTTGGTSGGASGGSSTSTLDKILGIFTGIATIFGKTKTTTTPTGSGTGSSSGTGGSSSGSSGGGEDPTPSNDAPSFGEWFAKNWIWAVPAIIIIPGGLILLIVTLVKSSKKKNEIAAQNRIPYDGNKI